MEVNPPSTNAIYIHALLIWCCQNINKHKKVHEQWIRGNTHPDVVEGWGAIISSCGWRGVCLGEGWVQHEARHLWRRMWAGVGCDASQIALLHCIVANNGCLRREGWSANDCSWISLMSVLTSARLQCTMYTELTLRPQMQSGQAVRFGQIHIWSLWRHWNKEKEKDFCLS